MLMSFGTGVFVKRVGQAHNSVCSAQTWTLPPRGFHSQSSQTRYGAFARLGPPVAHTYSTINVLSLARGRVLPEVARRPIYLAHTTLIQSQ